MNLKAKKNYFLIIFFLSIFFALMHLTQKKHYPQKKIIALMITIIPQQKI